MLNNIIQRSKFNFIKDLLEGEPKCYLASTCLYKEWGLTDFEPMIIQLGSNINAPS